MIKNLLISLLLLAAFCAGSKGADDLAEDFRVSGTPVAKPTLQKATELFGMDVKNPVGEKLGEIRDVVVHFPQGKIVYCVLASGGVLGIGDKLLALPPTSFSPAADGKHLVLNSEKEFLKEAPGFDKNHWPELTDTRFVEDVYVYYGKPSFRDNDSRRIAIATRKNRIIDEPAGAEKDGRLKFARASQLIGAPIQDSNGERLGDLGDLALELGTGRIRYAVLSTGGFLGVGEKLFALPTEAFTQTADEKSFVLNSPKSALKSGPGFDRNHWPAGPDKHLIDGQSGKSPVVDKSTVNEPAGARSIPLRHPKTNPPRGSDSDWDLTRRIRQAMVGDKALSLSARNVQISVSSGRVTLHGTVKSSEEKHVVLSKAWQLAGYGNVEDKIEIKP